MDLCRIRPTTYSTFPHSSTLQAENVLLQTQPNDPRGIIAKVSEFLPMCPHFLFSTLQAENVLLQTQPNDPRGIIAKVSDFGLSLQMDTLDTHVSKAFQGTMTVSVNGCVDFLETRTKVLQGTMTVGEFGP